MAFTSKLILHTPRGDGHHDKTTLKDVPTNSCMTLFELKTLLRKEAISAFKGNKFEIVGSCPLGLCAREIATDRFLSLE